MFSFFVQVGNNIYFFYLKQLKNFFIRQLAHTRQTLYSEHFGRTIKSVTAMVVVRHLHLEAERSAEAALSLLEDVGGGLVGLNHLNIFSWNQFHENSVKLKSRKNSPSSLKKADDFILWNVNHIYLVFTKYKTFNKKNSFI